MYRERECTGGDGLTVAFFVTVLGDYQQWFALPAEGFANGRRKGI